MLLVDIQPRRVWVYCCENTILVVMLQFWSWNHSIIVLNISTYWVVKVQFGWKQYLIFMKHSKYIAIAPSNPLLHPHTACWRWKRYLIFWIWSIIFHSLVSQVLSSRTFHYFPGGASRPKVLLALLETLLLMLVFEGQQHPRFGILLSPPENRKLKLYLPNFLILGELIG